jgi:hypothetical protein
MDAEKRLSELDAKSSTTSTTTPSDTTTSTSGSGSSSSSGSGSGSDVPMVNYVKGNSCITALSALLWGEGE